ncbi:MAG: sugar transferase [Frankiales bacterium]|nr:sugar transferase [Frankiales bacterium]
MRAALITLAHGRHDHLALQAAAVGAGTRAPDPYVVVAMADPALDGVVTGADVVHVRRDRDALPLAEARNAGAARARAMGAELLVFLDVDCVPAAGMLARYAEAAAQTPGVLLGPVGYLPPRPVGGYDLTGLHECARPHPARPVPREGELAPVTDPDLFWSLSFAMRSSDWSAVGGFCEGYRGYGGEDTDFAQQVVRADLPLIWVGGAWAYHQHHDDGADPADHLDDILRNATLFHRRWGRWPMSGWLTDFAARGLAHYDAGRQEWARS